MCRQGFSALAGSRPTFSALARLAGKAHLERPDDGGVAGDVADEHRVRARNEDQDARQNVEAYIRDPCPQLVDNQSHQVEPAGFTIQQSALEIQDPGFQQEVVMVHGHGAYQRAIV